MGTLKVKFFIATADLLEKIRGYYRARNMYVADVRGNYFEYLFEIKDISEKDSEFMIPPFAASHFAGTGESIMEEYLKEIAVGRGVTVSVAESCSGGQVADRITNVPGSSNYFIGSVVAYSNQMKVSQLGVSEGAIRDFGAVSAVVAEEMAGGIAGITGSDYALSITGVAGPEGGTEEKPVGTVWFGIVTPFGRERKRIQFAGTRQEIKRKVSSFAIFNLMKAIRSGGNL